MAAGWLRELLWDAENVDHIGWHGVVEEEVEEVVFGDSSMTAASPHPLRTLFVGPTDAGRFLCVVIARTGEGQGRVITARDASGKERDAYKTWRESL